MQSRKYSQPADGQIDPVENATDPGRAHRFPRAACDYRTGVDPELFYPEDPATLSGVAAELNAIQIEEAKALCAACPVFDACKRYALESGDDHGILYGTTSFERRDQRSLVLAEARELVVNAELAQVA